MIQIKPVSDLRNKYPEIEELVLKEDEPVYLTKNGYGSMVLGITLMVISWQQMVGIMPHGMVNTTHTILMSMVTM